MARIFSWCVQSVSGTCFSYLAKKSGSNYTTGYTISDSKLNSGVTKNMANIVSGYTRDTYHTQFDAMKAAIAAKPGFANVEWNDWTYYYDISGDNLVMITGLGVGVPGPKGDKGDEGPQGVSGSTGKAGNGRNVMCYCGLPSGLTPTRANVIGGKFYPNKWAIDYPTDPIGLVDESGVTHYCQWGDSNEYGSEKVVWMTNADFPSSTGNSPTESVSAITKSDSSGSYTWAKPIQISGPKGDMGADGERIEFVYKRCQKRTDPVPARPTGTTEEDAERQGWTDHPSGISEDYKVEYMSQHFKDDNEEWGEWSDPVLWASWGEDGNDGDGIEYIFAVTQYYDAPEMSTLPSVTSHGGELADHWQEPEIWDYISANGLTSHYVPWTDDPSDVSDEEPFEWVSIRRCKWDKTQEHSVYGPFEEPKLWAHWGKNGDKGDDGTSLNVKIRKDTLGHLLKSFDDAEGGWRGNVPKNGYTYAIGEGDNTKMYVFMPLDESVIADYELYNPPLNDYERPDEDYLEYYWPITESGVTNYYWFSYCGFFHGEDGMSAYMHMKYGREWKSEYTGYDHYEVEIEGKTVDICFTTPQGSSNVKGETPGPYMAVYCDNIHDDRGDLEWYCGKLEGSKNLWERFKGDDGQSYGQEQIFFRGMTLSNKPSVRTVTEDGHGYEAGEKILNITYTEASFRTLDWVPVSAGFTDVPIGIVNGTYNFEWVCTRRLLEDGTWSYFSEPALFNEASDSADFQVEYSTWSGTTTPVLQNASAFTGADGTFDETAWRNAHSQYGTWSDSISNSTIWMATAQRINKNSNSATTLWSDWQITRCKGITGKAGNGRNVVCYCITDSAYTVTDSNVSGGSFFPNVWRIQFPTDPTGHVTWQDSNETSDKTKRVWMINADFPSSTGTSEGEQVFPIVKEDGRTWSSPICITGEKGDAGADGESVEFIYWRVPARDDSTHHYKPDWPSESQQVDDFCPWVTINGQQLNPPQRWKDNPQGISYDNKVEYMCQRKKDDQGVWGPWSQVNLWSSWGEDGIDGDGVEYIFAVTKDLTQASYNAIKGILPSTTSHGGELAPYWQEPEIWDTISANTTFRSHYSKQTSTYSGWTDDPADVSPDEPYEWVAIRRKKYDESQKDSFFLEFEDPVLWARWADDGESVYTSFAFTALQVGMDISNCTVHGGTYDSPIPTTTKSGSTSIAVTWYDTAPHSTDIIWMTTGVFKKKYDGWEQVGSWSSPQRMEDTANFEVIYSPRENVEAIPTGFTKEGVNISPAWLTRANAKGWYDEISDFQGDAIWMATIQGSNNVFNDADWQIMKIKGEKGESGATGVSKFRSIVFKRTNGNIDTPSGGTYTSPLPNPQNDWHDTIPSGEAKLWMSSRTFSSDGQNDPSWCTPSQCTDTEYIDYEWTTHWTTMADAVANKPLKSSPNQTITPQQNNYWYDEPIEGALFMAVKEVSNGAYVNTAQTAWTVSQVKGEKGADGQSDVDYLKNIFEEVDSKPNEALLRGFIGVTSGGTDNVVAMMNGSGSTEFTDEEHGTLMIAAGIDGGLGYARDAKFRVYQDGTMYAKNGIFEGTVQAGDEDGYGFKLSSNGDVDISNKNVQINNSGIFFKNDSGDNVLSVVNKAYHSLTEFVDSMNGGSYVTGGGREIVFRSETYERSQTVAVFSPSSTTRFDNTTFTVSPGYTNKVTVTIRDSITGGLVALGSGIAFGSGTLSYYGEITLVNEDGVSQGSILSIPSSSITTSCTATIKTGPIKKTLSVGPGTYSLAFQGTIQATGNISGTIPETGYEWKLILDLNNGGGSDDLIQSYPANSGVEIFRNGFAVKNSPTNYIFAAAPDTEGGSTGPERLIIAMKSGGDGIYFSGGTQWNRF